MANFDIRAMREREARYLRNNRRIRWTMLAAVSIGVLSCGYLVDTARQEREAACFELGGRTQQLYRDELCLSPDGRVLTP